MRFPKLTDLDRDQNAIYSGAPPEGTVLIGGPPGTGKSVIAFHRAHMLARLKRDPKVIMFNSVLAQYTSNRGGVAPDVRVSTLHKWAADWWGTAFGTRMPLPFLDGDRFAHDWSEIQAKALLLAQVPANVHRLNWGHLIIDEGQDFSPALYAFLMITMTVANSSGARPQLAVTVMADENQRLTPTRNATLEQIRQNLGLFVGDRNVFFLKKNYRNTKEIAEFASFFYVGLPTGKPTAPTRSGDLPVISWVDRDKNGQFLDVCASKIARYAALKRTEEIAVVAMRDATRSSMFNRLKTKLQAEGIAVQSYSFKDENLKASDLKFDQPGHVTVINAASAKGLEFDSVFLIDPGILVSNPDGSSFLNAKMTMYVLASRARSFLNVMLVADQNSHTLMEIIPDAAYEKEDL